LPRQILLKKYLAATAGINTKKNPSTTSNTTSEYAQKIPKRALSREESPSGNDGLFPKEINLDSQSAPKQGSNIDASNYHSTFWGDKKPENRVGVCGVVGSRRSLRGNGTSSSSHNVKNSFDNEEDGDTNDPQNLGVYTSAAAIADAAAAQKWVDEWSREISYNFKSDDLWDGKRGDSADSDSVTVTCSGLKRGSKRGRRGIEELEGLSTADERDNQRGISLESRGSIGSRSRTPDRPGSSGSVRRRDANGGNDQQGLKNGSADSYGSFEGERGSVSRGRGERRHSEGAGRRDGAELGGGLGVGTGIGVGMGMEQEDISLRAEAADRQRQQRAQQLSEGLPVMTVAALSRLIMLR
jgi:hypothetical protein